MPTAHTIKRIRISIHTSPKGGDAISLVMVSFPFDFNPHLPEGR